MPDTSPSWFARHFRLWATAYLAVVALLGLLAAYTLAVSFWRGPWRDMWEALPFIEKALAGQATLADYWEQYGFSHRPLLSRWFWVADMRWAAGSNLLLLAVSLAMQVVIFLTVRAVLLRDGQFTAQQRLVIYAGVLFCLGNITQVFNFLHTFDVQWFLVTGFVLLALERLLAAREHFSPWQLSVAWLCVLVASLNNFSALVIWPVSILLLCALRFPRWQLALYSLLTAAYLWLYFHDLPTGGDSLTVGLAALPWQQQLQALWAVLVVFPLWYLSNPLSFQLATEGPLQLPWPVSWLAPLLAAVLLLFAARHWLLGLLQRQSFTAVAWLGLALVLYGYGVAVVTALGRALFWDNVYALRYQNIVLLFWIGIVLWLATVVRDRATGLFLGAALLLVVFTVNIGWQYENILRMGNRTRDAHLALVVGLEKHLSAIQATVSRSHLGQDSNYTLAHEAEFLRSIQAGPYADSVWQVPPFDSLQQAPACRELVAQLDVHGDDAEYARLSLGFTAPVRYSLIAWFDADLAAPSLLVAVRADTLLARLQQSVQGFTEYAGFARLLPQQAPAQLFAREGDQWCRLPISAVTAR